MKPTREMIADMRREAKNWRDTAKQYNAPRGRAVCERQSERFDAIADELERLQAALKTARDEAAKLHERAKTTRTGRMTFELGTFARWRRFFREAVDGEGDF